MKEKNKKLSTWVSENIGAIVRILIVIFIIVGTIYAIDSNILRDRADNLWLIIGAFLLVCYFLDDYNKHYLK